MHLRGTHVPTSHKPFWSYDAASWSQSRVSSPHDLLRTSPTSCQVCALLQVHSIWQVFPACSRQPHAPKVALRPQFPTKGHAWMPHRSVQGLRQLPIGSSNASAQAALSRPLRLARVGLPAVMPDVAFWWKPSWPKTSMCCSQTNLSRSAACVSASLRESRLRATASRGSVS